MNSIYRLGVIVKYTGLAVCVYWLLKTLFANELPADVGDGLMHYYIAQASWSDPVYFLDHWGKPLFTLLASPFAQGSFNGVGIFNCCVFLLTSFIAFRILTKANVSDWLQALFPFILLTANDVVTTHIGGLTEPLFNLFLVLAMFLLQDKKWLFFAIIISFMPFLRSEGQLPVILGVVILVYQKQWKSLPFIATGFVIYGIAGLLLLGNFWWYFTDSPYAMANDIYGSGTWDHYLTSYRNYLGNPGLYLVILGVPMAVFLLIKKRWEALYFDLAFLAFGTFLGVVVLHSYFWATGQNGSLGLTRIATQGATAFLLMQLFYISKYPFWKKPVLVAVTITGIIGIGMGIKKNKKFPTPVATMDRLIVNAGEFIQPNISNHKVYYYFPLVGYVLGDNPLITGGNTQVYTGQHFRKDVSDLFKEGDFLIWDSHFSPREGNLELLEVEKANDFVLVRSEQMEDKRVLVFQFQPGRASKAKRIQLEDKNVTIQGNAEYTDVFTIEELESMKGIVQFKITGSSHLFRFVVDDGTDSGYLSFDLSQQEETVTVDNMHTKNVKVYVWNPDKVKGQLQITGLSCEQLPAVIP